MKEKYNWNLQDIFENEEQFKKEKGEIADILEKIKTYQGILCNTSENLYNCYKLYEQALEKFEKVYAYGMLKYHLDMSNQEGIKIFKEVEGLGTEFSVATSFMTPEITYADENTIKEYIKEERLKGYERDIKDILNEKKHVLSKEEENILANFSETVSAPENTFDTLTNAEFKFGTLIDENGKEVEMTDSTYTLFLKNKDRNVRKQAFDLMYKKYSEFINTITEMYISNVKAKATTAKLRKYNSSLEEAVEHDDASLKVYESLIEAVNEDMNVNYEFIKLKKEMLNLDEMHMYDLYVSVIELDKEHIEFDKGVEMIVEGLAPLGKEYLDIFTQGIKDGWVDKYMNKGKRGGAYSWGGYDTKPYVLLNYNYQLGDVSTLAHEMGHSIHSYYSRKEQSYYYAGYTLFCAEVASTTNEALLIHHLINTEKDKKRRLYLINQELEQIRTTVFRQMMFAEFELWTHESFEQGMALTAKDYNEKWHELNVKYFGADMIVDEEIDVEWSRIPHFFSDFYVYQYATGYAAASAFAKNILDGKENAVEKYVGFLKSGGSDYPIEILKKAGVDMTTSMPLQATIDRFNELLEMLEKEI